MIKPRKSLFTAEQKSAMRKPQYQALNRVREQVEIKTALWLNEACELSGNQGMILARPLVDHAVKALQSKIPASAPDVLLSDKDWIENVFIDVQILAQKWDEEDKLVPLLEEQQIAEDKAKHDF